MSAIDLATWLAIGLGASCAALTVLLLGLVRGPLPRHDQSAVPDSDRFRVVLHDGCIADLSPAARRALNGAEAGDDGWPVLRAALALRFPDLPASMPEADQTLVSSGPGLERLELRVRDGWVRVDLAVGEAPALPSIGTAPDELALLRIAVQSAPGPIWVVSGDGSLRWHNPAYADLAGPRARTAGIGLIFNLPARTGAETGVRRNRICLPGSGADQDRWFEVSSHPLEDGEVHYAANIDAIVRAEVAQRNFVQTLTKTFAHLPIGLAIFDVNRQLVLFNPALIDLTALSPEFLSSRPGVMAFFDQLRDARMMPEPKNYASWREQMTELVEATCDDRYSETWTLPSGLTYKISGRPHPDGAIAFLIEDISAEVSLTRRFRSELNQTQSVLDALDDAVAVFSSVGVLTLCNRAYRDLWASDPEARLADTSVADECRRWQLFCPGSEGCDRLRRTVLGEGDLPEAQVLLDHESAGALAGEVRTLGEGRCLVRFVRSASAASRPAARAASATIVQLT